MESKNIIPEKKITLRTYHNIHGYSLADCWRGVVALKLRLERVKGFKVLSFEQSEKLSAYLLGAEKQYDYYESKINKDND